jgi:hypothetical protein
MKSMIYASSSNQRRALGPRGSLVNEHPKRYKNYQSRTHKNMHTNENLEGFKVYNSFYEGCIVKYGYSCDYKVITCII